jgi:hypothetical protein
VLAPLSTALALALVLADGASPAPAASPGAEPAAEKAAEPGAAPAIEAAPVDTAPAADADDSAAALIRRCVAAYGGDRGAVRLARVRVEGTVTSTLTPGQVGQYRRTFARSNRLRIEVQFPKARAEVRVLDGPRGFRYGEPAPAPVTAALQLQAARLDLPALLKEWETRADDRGEVTHEGARIRVLGLELAQGLLLEIGIEPQSGRIRYVHGVGKVGPRPIELFTIYRDHRVVDGVLVAFREEGWANGEPTGDVVLGKVEFLDDVPEETFRP